MKGIDLRADLYVYTQLLMLAYTHTVMHVFQ